MIHIKSTATLAKAFQVRREKTDDESEHVIAHLKIGDCLVDRDQLDEIIGLPVGWSTGALFDDLGGPGEAPQSADEQPWAGTPEGRALAVLELTPPVTVAEVKARYKMLVKKHHPDANGGAKAAEERFKQISEAYRIVLAALDS